MMKSKKKIKIDIVIFILVFVVLIVFVFSPFLSSVYKTTKDLSSKKNTLNLLENQITALQDFQNNKLSYQQDIKKINQSFVSTEAPVEFIEFLEKLANNHGLDILLSSVKDVSDKKGSRLTTDFQATITGDYPAILSFLKKLEQSLWLIQIDQVNIAMIEKGDSVGQVTLTLGLKTFSNYLGTTP